MVEVLAWLWVFAQLGNAWDPIMRNIFWFYSSVGFSLGLFWWTRTLFCIWTIWSIYYTFAYLDWRLVMVWDTVCWTFVDFQLNCRNVVRYSLLTWLCGICEKWTLFMIELNMWLGLNALTRCFFSLNVLLILVLLWVIAL